MRERVQRAGTTTRERACAYGCVTCASACNARAGSEKGHPDQDGPNNALQGRQVASSPKVVYQAILKRRGFLASLRGLCVAHGYVTDQRGAFEAIRAAVGVEPHTKAAPGALDDNPRW